MRRGFTLSDISDEISEDSVKRIKYDVSERNEPSELEWDFGLFKTDCSQQNLKHIQKVLNQNAIPSPVQCKDEEKLYIQTFVNDSINMGYSSGLLLIGGVSDTENIIWVKEVIDNIKSANDYRSQKIKFVHIDLNKLQKSHDIFKSILYSLSGKLMDWEKARCILIDHFQNQITKKIKFSPAISNILVLYSAQLLLYNEQDLQLIKLFNQWVSNKKSHLTVVFIEKSNQLSTYLKQTKHQYKINYLTFNKYSAYQLQTEINKRLKKCGSTFSLEAKQFIQQEIYKKQRNINQWRHILIQIVYRHMNKCNIPFHRSKSSKIFIQDIPPQVVKQVINQHDNCSKTFKQNGFLQTFKLFPASYKLILAYLCKFYSNKIKNETSKLTLHNLFKIVPIHTLKQLRHILYDLKDLGIISINYKWLSNSRRQNFNQRAQNGVQEETISLLIDYKQIIKAIELDSTCVKIQQPIDEQKVEQINFEAAIKLQGESIQQEQQYQCQQLSQIQSKLIKIQQQSI